MKKRLLNIIIIVLIVLLAKEIFMIIYTNYNNEKEIKKFYTNSKKYSYTSDLMLEIPKINLKQIVKKANNNYSNLNTNLVYYKNNNLNKKIIIFGHSGIGYGVYFNRLDELKINDTCYLYKNNYKQVYKVEKIFEINEDNTSILNIENTPNLILITCKKMDKNKRLVVKLVKYV